MRRFTLRTDPEFLDKARRVASSTLAEEPSQYGLSDAEAAALHYLLWSGDGESLGVSSYRESFDKWLANRSSAEDLVEIIDWQRTRQPFVTYATNLPFPCHLRIHAAYGLREITAAFGKADLVTSGPAGSGVIPIHALRAYIHLVTFRKEDRDFAPNTRYKDYPVSSTVLHWESQSNTTRNHQDGQNYIHFRERGYTILFFARLERKIDGETAPFLFLGPAKGLLSCKSDRPIQMLWELEHAIPAELFEEARAA